MRGRDASRVIMKNKLTAGFHLHHIIPKHLGGTEDANNLVLLHPIDHAIAHLVRSKIYKSSKDISAAQYIQSHLTEEEIFSVDVSGKNNPMFGKKRPDLSERNRTRLNPLKGKSGSLSKTSRPIFVEFMNGDCVYFEEGLAEFSRRFNIPEGSLSAAVSTGQGNIKHGIKYAGRP